MNEVELRQACLDAREELLLCFECGETIAVLEAFARRMMAVGLRMSGKQVLYQLDARDHADWCEAEAKRLDSPNPSQIDQSPIRDM